MTMPRFAWKNDDASTSRRMPDQNDGSVFNLLSNSHDRAMVRERRGELAWEPNPVADVPSHRGRGYCRSTF
jgi:hypothetical protein